MATNRFWHLCGPNSQNRHAWWDDEMDLEQVICPVDKGHMRGGKRLTDLSVSLPGKTVEDFVWTWHSECMIQDHVLERFRAEKFTGFEVKPVKARFKKAPGIGPPRLWEIVVTGWGGIAPPESGVRVKKCCDSCGLTVYSGFTDAKLLMDESKWDGSDFFMVWPLPKFIFVTDRLARFIRDQRYTGARLVAMEELEPVDGLGASHLSNFMPEARAREIGEPLGIY